MKKCLSIIVVICLFVGMLPTAALAAGASYADVELSAWYYEAVEYVTDSKMMQGTGNNTFEPNGVLTRAQLCQILYNIEESPSAAGGGFSDVASGAWYYNAVNWAASVGIVNGVGDGLFNPDADVTREQMVTILYRYADYKDYDVTDTASIEEFTDDENVGSYAETPMKWAVASGIITGTSATTISPQGTATRAQAAAVLMRFTQRMELLEQFYAQNVEDFDEYEVINLDNSDESNFAVLVEDAVVANSSSRVNKLVSADEEEGIFKFSNIDESISELKPGDVLYTVYGTGDEEYILLKVGEIEIDGKNATITEGEASLEDIFEYVDVDVEIVTTDNASNVAALPENMNSSAAASILKYSDYAAPAAKTQKTLGDDKTVDFKFGVDSSAVSVTGNVKMTLTLKIKYSSIIDINEIKLAAKTETKAEIELKKSITKKEDTVKETLYSQSVPIGASGLFADVEIYGLFDVDLSVDGTIEAVIKTEEGIRWVDGEKKEIKDSDADISADIGGEFNVTFAVGIEVGVSALKVLSLSLGAEGGIELDGEAEAAKTSLSGEEKHLCALCINGHADIYVKADFKGKVGFSKKHSWTIFDWTIGSTKLTLGEFYISFMNGTNDVEFGWGECPHKQYLVTVTVLDESGGRISDADIVITADYIDNTGETEANGVYTCYVANGTYNITAYDVENNTSASGSVTVNGKAASIVLTIKGLVGADGIIYVSTVEELKNAIGSNRHIIMNAGKYSLNELHIENANNLVIEGADNASLISYSEDDLVILAANCKNLTIKNLTIGHEEYLTDMGCSQGVIYLLDCAGAEISECDIYGCGVEGIAGSDSDFVVRECTIRDCSANIAYVSYGSAEFYNCKFLRNGYVDGSDFAAFLMWDATLYCENCTFANNLNYEFTDENRDCTVNMVNCTFTNNTWQ